MSLAIVERIYPVFTQGIKTMGTKRTRKTRTKLVKPEGGFTSPILKWHGEAMPNRQAFASEDQEYNYLVSRRAWLDHELATLSPIVAQLSKLTREQRLAQLADQKAEVNVLNAMERLGAKLGADDTGKAKKAMLLFKAGELDEEMMAIKYRKGSPEFKAALVKAGYKPQK